MCAVSPWVFGCLAVVAYAPHHAGCHLLDSLVIALGTKLKAPVFTPERPLLELPVWKHLRSSVLFF